MTKGLQQILKKLDDIFAAQGGGAAAVWGAITGTLSNQSDLQTALNAKLAASALSDAPYDEAAWNGDTTHAPSKNAVRDKIESMAAPYLVYTALLTQSSTDAPVATVLQNTLGGTVVWSYVSTGEYTGTLASVFTANKTACFISGVTLGDVRSGSLTRTDDNIVSLKTIREGVGVFDGVLTETSVEIRVYP